MGSITYWLVLSTMSLKEIFLCDASGQFHNGPDSDPSSSLCCVFKFDHHHLLTN